MTIVGEPPHPQALFVGFGPGDENALRAMRKLVAGDRVLSHPQDVQLLRGLDFDVAILKGDGSSSSEGLPDHLHLLVIGGASPGTLRASNGATVRAAFRGQQPGTAMQIAEGLEQPLRGLVNRELVPWLSSLASRPFLKETAVWNAHPGPRVLDGQAWVKDADGNVIAGDFQWSSLSSSGARCWVMPFEPEDLTPWLSAALESWREHTPERFKDLPSWEDSPAWRTSAEEDAAAALTALERERERVVGDLDARELKLKADMILARQAAMTGQRRLLTDQGDELVQAVAAALTVLGFEVTDMDAQLAPGEPRREDLRVADPDVPHWTNITEVKGYAGGGRARDLIDLGKYAEIYRVRNSESPVTRWYVVNQMRRQDPAARPSLLQGEEDLLESFAETGGLAIDTRALFELANDVDCGRRAAADVRTQLREARGRFSLA